ncbi:GDSL-type esterase/lipase family protein [Terriglobus sp. RCC_193]|uniref:SGNH/GDSL hydrolase family protein n=1 Tax=Terriglobus sp. RCC_193 TaxID=3239218 RepID=UPI0035244E8E
MRAQVRVINDGFPGENTEELDSRIDGALRAYHPQIVVLFVGANDALNDKKLLPSAYTERHLEAMVKSSTATGAQVVMVQIHTPDMVQLMKRHKLEEYEGVGPLQRLAVVNDFIAQVAQKEHTGLVRFGDVLNKAGGANHKLSTDGVHLTAKGYGLLAQAVHLQLPANLPANTTILCFGDSLTYGIGVRPPNGAPETPETYPSQLRSLLR